MDLDNYKEISRRFYGKAGDDAHHFFDLINARFFSNELERTLITFEVMPYGGCVGLTNINNGHIKIKYGTDERHKISFTPDKICILLHEMIHYNSIKNEKIFFEKMDPEYQKKMYSATSHNNLFWINECQRIYKEITGNHLDAGIKKIRRNPENGKHERYQTGSIPLEKISRFPHSIINPDDVRKYLENK